MDEKPITNFTHAPNRAWVKSVNWDFANSAPLGGAVAGRD